MVVGEAEVISIIRMADIRMAAVEVVMLPLGLRIMAEEMVISSNITLIIMVMVICTNKTAILGWK